MKKQILILFFTLLSFTAFSQVQIAGGGDVQPTGNYAAMQVQFIRGATQYPPTLTDRNNIADYLRMEGMLAYVVSTKETFQLQGGITNANWVLLAYGADLSGYYTKSQVDSIQTAIIALIPAPVDISGKVNKSGDTMTGALTSPRINLDTLNIGNNGLLINKPGSGLLTNQRYYNINYTNSTTPAHSRSLVTSIKDGANNDVGNALLGAYNGSAILSLQDSSYNNIQLSTSTGRITSTQGGKATNIKLDTAYNNFTAVIRPREADIFTDTVAYLSDITTAIAEKANSDGSNATGTWGINISGNAATATAWGGINANFSAYGDVITQFIGRNSTGVAAPFTIAQTQSALGLGSAAYQPSSAFQAALGYTPYNPASYPVNSGGETLQSVLARNNRSTVGIIIGDEDLELTNSYYLGNAIVGTLSNHPLTLWTNSGERVRIMPNGNVGIGTTNPYTKLDIAGTMRNMTSASGLNNFETQNTDSLSYGLYSRGGGVGTQYPFRFDTYDGTKVMEALGASVDIPSGNLSVAGTVTAAPATASNHLVTKAQLDNAISTVPTGSSNAFLELPAQTSTKTQIKFAESSTTSSQKGSLYFNSGRLWFVPDLAGGVSGQSFSLAYSEDLPYSGKYTPTIASISSGIQSVSPESCTYNRIGNIVTVIGSVYVYSKGTSTGGELITFNTPTTGTNSVKGVTSEDITNVGTYIETGGSSTARLRITGMSSMGVGTSFRLYFSYSYEVQ